MKRKADRLPLDLPVYRRDDVPFGHVYLLPFGSPDGSLPPGIFAGSADERSDAELRTFMWIGFPRDVLP